MESGNSKTAGLTGARERINAIDDQIAELLRQRIEIANTVMNSKPKFQIIDTERENEILNRYSHRLLNLSTSEKIKRLVAAILGCSKIYPESR